MPTVSLTLEDTNRTILAKSYTKIVQDIIDVIKIPSNSLVIMHRDLELSLTNNIATDTGLSNSNLPSTSSSRRVQVNISENYNEDELSTTSVNQMSAYPIFEDRDIDVFVYPIYIKSDITIDFTFVSPSKTEATRVRDDLRLRLSQTRNVINHELDYDILVPIVVEDFIYDIHTLKSRLFPESLEDYFRSHSTKRMFLMTDMANKENARIAVYEKQVRIIGLFDFNTIPEKIETDNENNNYKVTFSYKLSMDVPRAICLKYPVMICNKVLPSKYVQFIEDNRVQSLAERKKELSYIGGLQALSHFEAHRQLENRVDINLPINIPMFDEFNIRQGHKGYCNMVSFLTDVNEVDKRTLLNLKDIAPYYIPEELLSFIDLGEKNHIVNPYMSFMYIGVYQDGAHYDNNILTIDNNLNLISTVDLSLVKPIRIVISFILDITMLKPTALIRLLKNEQVTQLFINEYIDAYDNFRTENTTEIGNSSILHMFIYVIQYYLNLDNLDIIKSVLDIIGKNNLLYTNLVNVIYYNYYADIYRVLYENSIIDKNKVGRDYQLLNSELSVQSMKTVMDLRIVALRQ